MRANDVITRSLNMLLSNGMQGVIILRNKSHVLVIYLRFEFHQTLTLAKGRAAPD